MEENLQQLEATYGAPASLFERSASARARASGSTTEAVLAQWAGGGSEAADAGADAPVATAASSEAARGGLSGAALLAAVAEARGMPESLIERSASARASATGGSMDDVLRDWAKEEGLDVRDSSPSGGGGGGEAADGGGEASTAPVPSDKAEAADGGGEASTAPVPSSDAAAGALSGAALLAAVAEARGMPESLIERSASARAKTAGVELDDILRDWAEEEGLDVAIPPPEGEVSPSGDGRGEASTAPVPSSGAAAGAVSGAALLAAVAEARGMPESLVERSAKARAKSEGGSVDDVLLEWAREEGLEVGGADQVSAPTEPISEVPPVDRPEDLEELVEASDAGPAPKVDIPGPVEPEPVEEPEPEEPISPRTRYPAWLAAVLVVIPLLAVLYVVVVPNQPTCGSAGQLAIDPATGNAVGCDGAEYGAGGLSNLSAGAAIYDANCAVCHGVNGGGGAGPAMAGGAVLVAFPDDACESQIEWIALGSGNWPEATYGANDTPVAGGMPGFEGQLTELEIAQVTLYERVEFGGLEEGAAEAACGLGMEEG